MTLHKLPKSVLIAVLLFFAAQVNANTYTVSNNGTGTGTANSLDWALNQASLNAGADIIVFSTALTIMDGTITIPSDVTIDGSSGYAAFCTNGPRIIITKGTLDPMSLTLSSLSNVTIKGISFQGVAITVTGCTNFNFYGNWMNMDATGTAAANTFPIAWSGNPYFLTIGTSTNVTIGGTNCDERNVFSLDDGYNANGISVSGTAPFTFKGNYVGTDKNGTTGIASTNTLFQSTGLKINNCGTASNALTISDNVFCVRVGAGDGTYYGFGIYFAGTNTNATVNNNKIGVDKNGDVDASMYIYSSGIRVEGTLSSSTISNNTIGKAGQAGGGDLAQNSGILFRSATASNVSISNNLIGIDNSGANAANGFCGVYFYLCTTSAISITDNVIGNNGYGGVSQFGSGIAIVGPNSAGFTITGNYIGVSPTNANIGNANDGIIIQDGAHNITIGSSAANGRNYISFNKGKRVTAAGSGDPTYSVEPNAAIMMYNVQDITIKNNGIGISPDGSAAGQSNNGGSLIGGSGIIVQGTTTRRVTIGGMAANEQNTIAYNSGRGIMVIQGADYVQMEWNSIYCNTDYGIDINCRGQYGVGAANNSYGCTTFSMNTFTPPVTSVSGIRPTGGVVDVFGSNACASGPCKKQGQYRYTGTYTYPGTTTWNYDNGGITMYDDISATVTGTGGDCSSGICRTSEYSNCVDTPLPVSWLSFDASSTGAVTHLKWVTGKEKSNDYFVLERSINGENYEVIGEVDGSGNTSTPTSYSFDDINTLTGVVYYRIRQVDLDGKSSYSPVRTIEKAAFVDLIVSPVPNNGNFNLELYGINGNALVSITDVMGREIYTQQLNVNKYVLLPIEIKSAAGVYIINVTSGSESKTVRITVQ